MLAQIGEYSREQRQLKFGLDSIVAEFIGCNTKAAITKTAMNVFNPIFSYYFKFSGLVIFRFIWSVRLNDRVWTDMDVHFLRLFKRCRCMQRNFLSADNTMTYRNCNKVECHTFFFLLKPATHIHLMIMDWFLKIVIWD